MINKYPLTTKVSHMNEKLLNSEDLNQVAGGVSNWLYTVEDIETSPVFEGLKNMIAEAKRCNDLTRPDMMKELELRLALYARSNRKNEYRFKIEVCREFIRKYLPLV